MAVTLRYFARLRDLAGREEERIALDPSVTDGASLLAWLGARDSRLAEALAHPSVRVEVNGVIGARGAAIADGDEIGLLPPFSGG